MAIAKGVRRVGPGPSRKSIDTKQTDVWFRNMSQRMSIVQLAVAPTAAELPVNSWIVAYVAGSGLLRLFANYNGVIKGVTLA